MGVLLQVLYPQIYSTFHRIIAEPSNADSGSDGILRFNSVFLMNDFNVVSIINIIIIKINLICTDQRIIKPYETMRFKWTTTYKPEERIWYSKLNGNLPDPMNHIIVLKERGKYIDISTLVEQ